jgi:hypothetical protein
MPSEFVTSFRGRANFLLAVADLGVAATVIFGWSA